MIIKVNKTGKRFFFTKNGKEWDVQKMFEDITSEGVNLIRINVECCPEDKKVSTK